MCCVAYFAQARPHDVQHLSSIHVHVVFTKIHCIGAVGGQAGQAIAWVTTFSTFNYIHQFFIKIASTFSARLAFMRHAGTQPDHYAT